MFIAGTPIDPNNVITGLFAVLVATVGAISVILNQRNARKIENVHDEVRSNSGNTNGYYSEEAYNLLLTVITGIHELSADFDTHVKSDEKSIKGIHQSLTHLSEQISNQDTTLQAAAIAEALLETKKKDN